VIDPIVAWHEEHVYFNRLLGLLRRQLDVFHRGERPNYVLIQDIVSYLHDFADQCHHPREDEAFERLARHCPEMELALTRLHQEHRVIARAGEALLEKIDEVLADTVTARADIEMALATYILYYDNHIAKEEEDVLPRAAKELSPADWRAVKDAAAAMRDPLAEDAGGQRFRELRRQIALDA
jgi:hemerythrin-like domain-containing protein